MKEGVRSRKRMGEGGRRRTVCLKLELIMKKREGKKTRSTGVIVRPM